MTDTIEIALDTGDGPFASVYVELEDRRYATAKRVAARIGHAAGLRFVDRATLPVSPWMYFGRTESAESFRDLYPDRVAEIPAGATRVAVTRTGRVVALGEIDQAVEI